MKCHIVNGVSILRIAFFATVFRTVVLFGAFDRLRVVVVCFLVVIAIWLHRFPASRNALKYLKFCSNTYWNNVIVPAEHLNALSSSPTAYSSSSSLSVIRWAMYASMSASASSSACLLPTFQGALFLPRCAHIKVPSDWCANLCVKFICVICVCIGRWISGLIASTYLPFQLN